MILLARRSPFLQFIQSLHQNKRLQRSCLFSLSTRLRPYVQNSVISQQIISITTKLIHHDWIVLSQELLRKYKKLIMDSPTKSCALDPMPTELLKKCIVQIALPITNLVNKSLQTGIVQDWFKSALIRPLLKKPGLDSVLKNYRPVSDLPFISDFGKSCY